MLYTYCIIPYEGENFSFNHREKKISLLSYRDVAAVVAEVAADCDKMENELNEGAIREHEEIIRRTMKKYTVIPMAFGMIFKDKEVLQAMLEKSYAALKETLTLLHNKIEVGTKVILTDAARENLSSVKEDIENSLTAKAVKAVKGRLFSDKLLLNTSFLIEKEKLKEFSAEVARLEKQYFPLRFQYTGPWPPYSFIDIKIHAS